jgi:hypothetical protein
MHHVVHIGVVVVERLLQIQQSAGFLLHCWGRLMFDSCPFRFWRSWGLGKLNWFVWFNLLHHHLRFVFRLALVRVFSRVLGNRFAAVAAFHFIAEVLFCGVCPAPSGVWLLWGRHRLLFRLGGILSFLSIVSVFYVTLRFACHILHGHIFSKF